MVPERVVVLMFENRSFDHLLGYLDHSGLDPVSEDTTNPDDPGRPADARRPVFPLPGYDDVPVDPAHHFPDVLEQLTGKREGWEIPDDLDNDGFVRNYQRRLERAETDSTLAGQIMGCRRPDAVPALTTLAREFAVCSRWFCSVPSATWPNRLFAHGAQSENLLDNVVKPYTHPTIFDRLTEAGRSWAVYAGDVPQALAYVELRDAFQDRFNRMGEFFDDCREGTLPEYSFIEPRHFLWPDNQHPTHGVIRGDQLLREVYRALAANPEIWSSVLFVVTHDEHGGFFDRARPPATVPPHQGARDERYGFGFDLLGPRVPAVVVSPFIPPRTVDRSAVYDHASIVRTVRETFGIGDPLTARDAQAESLLGLLSEEGPREPPSLMPPATSPRAVESELEAAHELSLWGEGLGPDGELMPNDLQESLVELVALLDAETGARPTLRQAAPPVGGRFTSAAQVEAFVEDVRRRHMGSRREPR
jgi:phospholipase C